MKRIFAAALAVFSVAAFAATTTPISLLSPTGSTSGQAIVSTGPTTAPAWGAVSAGSLAPIAANTVLGNFTGSSAVPAAFAVPSCSTANSALKYTSGTGLSCGTTFALTSGNLSQFASTTSAQLLGVLSDETGSGAAVFGTSPTISTPTITGGTINNTAIGGVTPSTGAFTTISATGLITPSTTNGIKGTTAADNANAGSLGEAPTNSAGPTSLSPGVTLNIASQPLTAGDWDVECVAQTQPAGTTTTSQFILGVSTTSATFGSLGTFTQLSSGVPAGGVTAVGTPTVRVNVSSSTTTYCVLNVNFAVSTMQAFGYLRARRVR